MVLCDVKQSSPSMGMPTPTLHSGSRFHHQQVGPPLVSPPSRDLAGGCGAHSWSSIVSFTSSIESFHVLTVLIDSYIDRSSPSISPTDINGCALPDEDTVLTPADSMHASQYTFAKDDDESQDDNGDKGNDDDEDKI
jgi:hypothetical protein